MSNKAALRTGTCNRACRLGATWSGGGGAGRIDLTTAVDDASVSAGILAVCWGAMRNNWGVCVSGFAAGAWVSSSAVKSMNDLLESATVPVDTADPAAAFTGTACACNCWKKTWKHVTLITTCQNKWIMTDCRRISKSHGVHFKILIKIILLYHMHAEMC